MLLADKLKDDVKASMKNGDAERTQTLRLFLSEINNKTKEKFGGKEGVLTDEEALAVLQKEAKKRKEAIELYDKGGRKDLAKKESAELAILDAYLPKALTAKEIEAVVNKVIAEGAGDFNSAMKEVMKELKGRADGKLVGELIKGKLK